jgi:hypothetical protein
VKARPIPFYIPSIDHNLAITPPKVSLSEKTKYQNDPNALETLPVERKVVVLKAIEPNKNIKKENFERMMAKKTRLKIIGKRNSKYDKQVADLKNSLTEAQKTLLQEIQAEKTAAEKRESDRPKVTQYNKEELTPEQLETLRKIARTVSKKRSVQKSKDAPTDSERNQLYVAKIARNRAARQVRRHTKEGEEDYEEVQNAKEIQRKKRQLFEYFQRRDTSAFWDGIQTGEKLKERIKSFENLPADYTPTLEDQKCMAELTTAKAELLIRDARRAEREWAERIKVQMAEAETSSTLLTLETGEARSSRGL